jgi:hypothetical protein
MEKKKTMTSLIALLLAITIVASALVVIPAVDAAVNYYYTWAYCTTSVGTGSIGVGQSMLLVCWTKDLPPDIGETNNIVSSPTGRAGWYGWQINVTKPDNSTETVDMPYSDPVGADYIQYVPDMAGTYYIQAIFPATWKNTTSTQRFYTAAVSPVDSFTVTEEPAPLWPESPLPESYWTRPLNAAARAWFVLAGNRLAGASNVWPLGGSGGTVNNYAYGQGPETPHVLWSKPYGIGGLMDNRTGTISFETTHYQGFSFSPSIILDGKIYFTPRRDTHGSAGLQVVSLYSGNTLYLNYSAPSFSMAQIYNYLSPNQMGGFAYLWRTSGVQLPEIVQVTSVYQTGDAGQNMSVTRIAASSTVNRSQTSLSTGTVWAMYDGWTMNPIAYIANVSASGTQVYCKDGAICYYNLVNKGTSSDPHYYSTVWNNTAGTMISSQTGTGYWQWRPAGGTFGGSNAYLGGYATNYVHDGRVFYSQNFSIPNIIRPPNSYLNETGTIRAIRQDDYMIIGTRGWYTNAYLQKGWMMGVDLRPGHQGEKLWEMEYTPPFADTTKNITTTQTFSGGLDLDGVYPEDNVLTWHDVQQCLRWVYDLQTGELLWTSPPQPQLDYYSMSQIVYDHKLIAYGSYSGQMIAYDIRTGDVVWKYDSTNIGGESPYGNYPMSIGAVADGLIYTYTSEHHLIQPLWRGPNLRCINVTDGTEIFSTLNVGSGMGIADGILVAGSGFDNMIYAYGRGPSATTVAAGPEVTTAGTPVMVKGTVTDQTNTGRHNTNDNFDLINQGTNNAESIDYTLKDTPCISDKDMGRWMDYKYKQQIYPADATGVEVTLDVIDPNGNFFNIGTTTSDINGNYALPYTPDVPGTYKILATFAGSRAYGPSRATTYLEAVAAPEATAQPTAAPASVADMYLLPGIIGIIIAIIIVGIVLALLLIRKRP